MRFPVPFFVGTAFQRLAGVLHFLVEFRQHRLSNGHHSLPCEVRDCGAEILGEQKANCQEQFLASSIFAPLQVHSALTWLQGSRKGALGTRGATPGRSDGIDKDRSRDKMALWPINSRRPT